MTESLNRQLSRYRYAVIMTFFDYLPMILGKISSVVALVRFGAQNQPEGRAYTFIYLGDREVVQSTYQDSESLSTSDRRATPILGSNWENGFTTLPSVFRFHYQILWLHVCTYACRSSLN
jgi:hypothetical protein